MSQLQDRLMRQDGSAVRRGVGSVSGLAEARRVSIETRWYRV